MNLRENILYLLEHYNQMRVEIDTLKFEMRNLNRMKDDEMIEALTFLMVQSPVLALPQRQKRLVKRPEGFLKKNRYVLRPKNSGTRTAFLTANTKTFPSPNGCTTSSGFINGTRKPQWKGEKPVCPGKKGRKK